MKKFILTASTLALAGLLQAQEPKDTLRTDFSDGAYIKKNREILRLTVAQNGRNVEIMDSKTIASLPAQSVAELLTYVSGLEIRQRGIFGTQADIGTLGGSFDQTLILIDGVRYNDPQTGHHNLNLPVSLSQIDHIEILKGSAARLYGINSLAGAINIVTKIGSENYTEVQANTGTDFRKNPAGTLFNEQNKYQYGIQGFTKMGNQNFQHSFSLGYNTSSGQNYNNGFETYKGMYMGRYALGKGQLKWQLSYIDNQFGNNGYYASPIDKDAWERVRTAFTNLGYGFQLGKWLMSSLAHFRRNEDDYLLRKHQPSFYKNNHITRQYGLEQRALRSNRLGLLGLGVEYLSNNITSNRLGSHERHNFGAYAQQTYSSKNNKFSLNGGLYANYNTDYGFQLIPGFDVSYALNPQFTVFANTGTGTRQPTYTDLYYTSFTNVNNPLLQPENSITYEIGLKFFKKIQGISISGQLSGYYREVNDLIDWFKADSIRWKPENIHQQTAMGLDARLVFRNSVESGKMPKIYWDQFLLGFTYNQMELITDQINAARYSINNVKWQVSSSFQWKFLRNFSHTLTYRLRERISDAEPLHLFDTRLSYQITHWQWYVNVQNLTGVTYTEIAPIQMPKNWVTFGMVRSFK